MILMIFLPQAANVIVSTPNKTVYQGQSFELNVSIDPKGNAISGAQLDITFNKSLFMLNNVTEGNLFTQKNASTLFNSGTINNSAGIAKNVFVVILGPYNISTSGTFIRFKLTAIGQAGISEIKLSNMLISDPNGKAVPLTVTNESIKINSAPVMANIGNMNTNMGQNLTFALSSTDLNGDLLTYSASNLPPGATFYSSTATFQWTPAQSGIFPNVHFEVTDGMAVDSENITITVNNTPEYPFMISNIKAASGKTYTQNTLAVGSLLYIDRTYKFTSVPTSYIGLAYIKTATDDRYRTDSNFLQFDVNKDATIYVAYDDRISPKTSWLSYFKDTGDNLVRDKSNPFSIYARDYPAGHISLGGTSISSGGAGGSYVVIVKPLATPTRSILGVSITESPDPVISNGTSQVIFHVTSGSTPINGASVSASTNCGSMGSPIALTNSTGDSTAVFTAPSVATITTCTISATASMTGYNNGTGTDQIIINTVLPVPFLNSINVTPGPLSLPVGNNQAFTASSYDQYNAPYPATVTWSSSNTTVGKVDSLTGKFTALSPGTAMVNATNGTVTGTAFVTVNAVSPVLVISNITATSGKAYTQNTLAVGSLLYIDRSYKFTSIPSSYIGQKYIKTATDDRYRTESNFLQFDVNKGVTIYVAYDDRISPKASWLSSFTDTGDNVVRDGSTIFSIYARNYPAGRISLGGSSIPSNGAGGSYVVIVKPQ